MIRSMFTAISSLGLHQKYLDVVSNNLANANTTGFKSSRVLFQDQFAQLINPGAAPTDTLGGVNPTQVGLGVAMGYVSPVFTQGMLQSTGRNLDMAIQGDGFFVYGQDAGRRYSREGSMGLDATGYLVNSATGLRAQGWLADATGKVDTNLPVDDIKITTDKTLAKSTETVILGGNLSATSVAGDKYTVSMGVYDSLGTLRKASVEFTRGTTAAAVTTWNWKILDPVTTPPTTGSVGAGTISFDSNGQIVTPIPAASPAVSLPGSTGADPVTPTLDFSRLTMLTAANSAAVTSQDGLAAGSVSDVFVSANTGNVYLVYSNGLRQEVGQLAIARFTNPSGLLRADNSSFTAGLNSGEAQIGIASTGGRGTIASGYLEASNVDMAQEFTNMILAQRGFQASSRVITTSDEIMQELVNLKR
jgi:flagellar hook protein FlgE